VKGVFSLLIFIPVETTRNSLQKKHLSLISFLLDFFLSFLLILLKISFLFLLILVLLYCLLFGQSNNPLICAACSYVSKSWTLKTPTSAKRSRYGSASESKPCCGVWLFCGVEERCHGCGERNGTALIKGLILGWGFWKLTFERPWFPLLLNIVSQDRNFIKSGVLLQFYHISILRFKTS